MIFVYIRQINLRLIVTNGLISSSKTNGLICPQYKNVR